jgi:hypothetical protein
MLLQKTKLFIYFYRKPKIYESKKKVKYNSSCAGIKVEVNHFELSQNIINELDLILYHIITLQFICLEFMAFHL